MPRWLSFGSGHKLRLANTLAFSMNFIYSAIWVCLLTSQAWSSPQNWDESVVDSQNHLEAAIENGVGPGISVAVGYGDHVIWAAGFGFADLKAEKLVHTDTLFRVGSVSKTLTASALMRLRENQEVDIDLPASFYLRDFPEKEWSFTTRQLATHVAGIRHYRGKEFYLNEPFASMAESVSIFKDDPLLFEPGTSYTYSTYGWTLLSAVMEGATGKEYLEIMQAELFDPLSLDSTFPDKVEVKRPLRTSFYKKGENGFVSAPAVNNSYKWAGGGFLSTPSDLVRFALAHLSPGYLSAESLSVMFKNQAIASGETVGCGIGWKVGRRKSIGQWVGHSGGSVGGKTMLVLVPSKQIAVAVTLNNTEGPAQQLAFDVAAIFAEAVPAAPTKPEAETQRPQPVAR